MKRPLLSAIDMERSRNWIEFILNRPMAASPGDGFNYDSGNAHLLSAILAKVTGMSAEDYAKAKLFGPLGITAWKWRRDPQGISTGGYGLALHPRDMAKFGYLYLRNGDVGGQTAGVAGLDRQGEPRHGGHAPLICSGVSLFEFLLGASRPQCLLGERAITVSLMMVYPALDLVAVTTGRDGCAGDRHPWPSIAASIKSETAIQPDTAGTERLASVIRAISTEKHRSEVKDDACDRLDGIRQDLHLSRAILSV